MNNANAFVHGITITGADTAAAAYNKDDGEGGDGDSACAIRIDGGASVSNCVISSNSGSINYGAVYLIDGLVTYCTITNNRAGRSNNTGNGPGGGIRATGGIVSHCIISGNRAVQGGGVHLSGNGVVSSCVVTNNDARRSGGGIYMTGGTVEDTYIADNRADIEAKTNGEKMGGGIYLTGGVVNRSIVVGNTANVGGDGNISGALVFNSSGKGDYTLKLSSPQLNAGVNQEWMSGALDLAGTPRILNRVVDIGAYESELSLAPFIMLR